MAPSAKQLATCTLTFQRESFDSWLRDAEPLFYPHWKELTIDKELCGDPYPDVEKFRDVENRGRLLIVTARAEGQLVGYWVGAVLGHMHYPTSGDMAHTDMYFLHPDYRVGANGIELLEFAEQEARKAGAVKFYISCKIHADHTRLMEAMGFRKTDYVFTKVLR